MINISPVRSTEWLLLIDSISIKFLSPPLKKTTKKIYFFNFQSINFSFLDVYLQLGRRGFNIVLISRTQEKLDDISKAICEYLHGFWSTAILSSFFLSTFDVYFKLKCVVQSRLKWVWMMLRITQFIPSWLHDVVFEYHTAKIILVLHVSVCPQQVNMEWRPKRSRLTLAHWISTLTLRTSWRGWRLEFWVSESAT